MKPRMQLMLLLALALTTGVIWYALLFEERSSLLEVSFLSVGQGDAILIEGPTGVQVLIDGGPDKTVLTRLSEELPWYDRSLDVVIGTHPDKDHIGGLSYVLDRYRVDFIFHAGLLNDTDAYHAFTRELEEEGGLSVISRRGEIIDIGGGAYFRVLFPDRTLQAVEPNIASAVIQLIYGDVEFMLTGDAPESIENYLVEIEGAGLESEVLKLGHHGSHTSTSEIFVNAVSPMYAIVSAGKDNSYGHPHREVTDLLTRKNIQTFETFDEGTITFVTDGKTLRIKN